MTESIIPGQVALIVLLLFAALIVALIARRLRLPYTLVLVVVGLIAGVTHVTPLVTLDPAIVLFVFLPALLFEGAWNINARALKGDGVLVALLAVPGLGLALVVSATTLVIGLRIDWPLALLIGAIISSTDPIAALGLFRALRLPERLCLILEGESLFNDGTCMAAFTLLLTLILTPPDAATNWWLFALSALWLMIGGLVIGATLGLLAASLLRATSDHLVETGITFVVAYGSFLIGEELQTSGLLAVVAAGIVMGTYGRRVGLSSRALDAAAEVWDFAGFVANSLLFLLLGAEIGRERLGDALPGIAYGVLGVLAGRALMVYLISPLYNRLLADRFDWTAGKLPNRWRGLVLFSGLRGALSLALALSLPDTTPALALIRPIIYGVVLVTLVGQGVGLRVVVPRLTLSESQPRDGD